MAFKADASFLRFLTIGAMGTRQVMRLLMGLGFQPIELERYCTSNKIWATKIKRLRLPDLLCVRTGLRIEVRAKSNLKIRMSDAPNNPDRTWDAGLRNDDLVAFIACLTSGPDLTPAGNAAFFTVKGLRSSVGDSKLGPPKSASEGSERDREWPAIIPSRDGFVEQVPTRRDAEGKLVVVMEGDGQNLKRQTYRLKGKSVYVRPGTRFQGGTTIIAGQPPAMANLESYLTRVYDPLAELKSPDKVDRYSAVKALPYRLDIGVEAVRRLERLIGEEVDSRISLEAAGTAAILGSTLGESYIRDLLTTRDRPDLQMEAIFILTELRSSFALESLRQIADNPSLADSELRQAAIWGLGKSGHRSYSDLLPYINDEDENVALHAIAAFGADTPHTVLSTLAERLDGTFPRLASAASEVLRLVSGPSVVDIVTEKARRSPEHRDWALATLGRLESALVRNHLAGDPLLENLAPLLCLFGADNWLGYRGRSLSLEFLLGQYL